MPHVPGSTLKPVVRLPKDPADCWPWLSSINPNGHAVKTVGGKAMPAARWLWASLFGPIPHGMVVYHVCGNKACINPHHLRCGHQAQACREGPGSERTPVKLTPCDVRELRLIPVADRTAGRARILADQHGVTVGTIRAVWRGSSWRKPRPNNGPRKRAA